MRLHASRSFGVRLTLTDELLPLLSTRELKNVAAFEDIQARRSVVSDTLQMLTEQAKQWRVKIDLLEAGQHLDRAEALTSLGQLLDVCQNLRYAILSEDCTATWTSKEELHAIVGRIDETATKRRRYLDLAQSLSSGKVTHKRERTRVERLKQRDAAVAELMETSALAAPPDLPGPAVTEWLEWACNLDDSTGDPDLQHLKAFFPRVDDFVRQLELEQWQTGTVHPQTPTASEPKQAAPTVEISSTPSVATTNSTQTTSDKPTWLLDAGTSGSSVTESAALETSSPESAVAVEEPLAEIEIEPEPTLKIAESSAVVPIVLESSEEILLAPIDIVPAEEPSKEESSKRESIQETSKDEWSAPTESGKLCFFPADEVGKFSKVLADGQNSRKVQALLAVSHWLSPIDSNPVLDSVSGMRAQIEYKGTSDLLPVTPEQAQSAIDSDAGVLLFTGGADLLRWGLGKKEDERFAGISSVRRLSSNQIKAWFRELHKIELAEPQVLDMYRLTAGVPLLVGELHRLVIPDPKTPPTWLGFMIWTTVKTNFERRLPVIARELRNGSAAVRLTEREIRVLKMVAIASDNSTAKTIASNLQEDWDQYHRPELEALSAGDEESVAVLQGLGLLPMRRDYGLTAIQALLPLGADDPLRQIVSYL